MSIETKLKQVNSQRKRQRSNKSMTSQQWQTTKRLVILAQMIDKKTRELDALGIVMPQLEYVQSEILMTVFQLNGIGRNDDGVDYLCDPIFKSFDGDITLNEAMHELSDRLQELKQEQDNKL